jgi:hypothetical protein
MIDAFDVGRHRPIHLFEQVSAYVLVYDETSEIVFYPVTAVWVYQDPVVVC